VPALQWFKSSHSANNGDCVEVAFVKSSYSTNNGNCVEVAFTVNRVAARDSKNPSGPTLSFPAGAWQAMLNGIA